MSIPVLAVGTTKTLWYVARGAGIVALVTLTLSVLLGIVTSVRWSSPRWPRFVIELIHRNASLLAVVAIVIHVSSVVIDGFAPIGWKDVVIPFMSGYRPFWLGLGTLAFDLVLALVVTSLLRDRLGQRAWRIVHWLAYVCWPLVVVHGLASGSDTKLGFVFLLNVACIVTVLLALWWRLATGWTTEVAGRRLGAAATSLGALGTFVVWVATGPLAAGWAQRAGTPASLLGGSAASTAAATAPTTPTTTAPNIASGLPAAPFSVGLAGALGQSEPNANGLVTIRITANLNGGIGSLEVDLTGQPARDGGITLTSGQVILGATNDPRRYSGAVTSLSGNDIGATVRGTGVPTLGVTIVVSIDRANRVTGTLSATPASSAASPSPRRGDD